MVSPRCISTVETELKALGLKVTEVVLGKATYIDSKKIRTERISNSLKKHGFELIVDSAEKTVELIKTVIIELIHYSHSIENKGKQSNSQYISEKIGRSYSYLSKVFSRHKKITLEKYIILQRTERVKELIEYGEKSFSEIAYMVGYKNPTYLANQFKKIVGMSMGDYKRKRSNRKSLDAI